MRADAASSTTVGVADRRPSAVGRRRLAWSHSAGGAWRGRIAAITTAEDVTRSKTPRSPAAHRPERSRVIRRDPRLPARHLPEGWPAERAQQVFRVLHAEFDTEARAVTAEVLDVVPDDGRP
ncbi:hypothetical protein DQ238_03875 [Geodermatophilus sp. TF02-6]|nr:hypothetical protein DQ238_03875 [Geodermatophilus sp. TF02-6]